MQQEYRKIDLPNLPTPIDPAVGPRPRLQFQTIRFRERRHAGFFEVVKSSLLINTPEQFTNWVRRDVQKVLPHGAMACGLGVAENFGGRIQHLVTGNFPLEHLKLLQRPDGVITCPVIAQWIKTRRPVTFESVEQQSNSPWLESFRSSGLQNMMVHGRSDLHSRATSYFTFAGMPGRLQPQHAELLELLVPHLHDALVRMLRLGKREKPASQRIQTLLTKREHEILQWLGFGKTNQEIAQQLHISEHTVKNHVQNVLNKLNVSNRAEAVAKGLGE